MNASKSSRLIGRPPRSLPVWLAPSAFLASIAYLGAAITSGPHIGVAIKGFLFPLHLFLIASAPMIGGIAFLWADKAISDTRRRRLACALFVLLWTFAAISVVSFLQW